MTMTSKTHPLQEGARAVRARGLPRAYPNVYRGPGRSDLRACSRSSACSPRPLLRIPRRCDRVRATAGRGRLYRRPRRSSRGCVQSATGTGWCLVAEDEVQTGSVAPDGCSRWNTWTVRARPHDRREVDRRRPAAVGRDRRGRRSWTTPHPGAAMGGTFHRQPSRAGGRLRRARRLRGGAARRPRTAPRRGDSCAHARLAVAVVAGLGTFAGWARCWRSSSFVTPSTKEPAPELSRGRDRRGVAARAACSSRREWTGSCIRVLCSLTTSDSELDDGLRMGRGARGRPRVAGG